MSRNKAGCGLGMRLALTLFPALLFVQLMIAHSMQNSSFIPVLSRLFACKSTDILCCTQTINGPQTRQTKVYKSPTAQNALLCNSTYAAGFSLGFQQMLLHHLVICSIIWMWWIQVREPCGSITILASHLTVQQQCVERAFHTCLLYYAPFARTPAVQGCVQKVVFCALVCVCANREAQRLSLLGHAPGKCFINSDKD